MTEPTVDVFRRPTENDLAAVPCAYCRAVLRAVVERLNPGEPFITASTALVVGQARILIHSAAGHPSEERVRADERRCECWTDAQFLVLDTCPVHGDKRYR